MKNTHVLLIIGIGLVMATGLALVLLRDTSTGNDTVSIGSFGKTGPFSIVHSYGLEKGIFAKHGVNISYNDLNDIYTCMVSLAAGKVDAVTASPGISAAAYADGENVSVGLALCRASNLMLIAKPGYTDVEALRGKKIGVMGTNSDSYRIIGSYMEDAGVVLGEDAEVVEIKNPANLLAGFKTDQLEAVVLMSQFALDALESGGTVLTDIDEAGKEVFGRSAYSTVMLLGDHFLGDGRLAKRFLRALRETAKEVQNNPDEAIRINSEFTGQSQEDTRALFEILELVYDLDQGIIEDIKAYGSYGVENGFFEKELGDDFFYDDWR